MGAFISNDGNILVVILKLHTQSLVVSAAAGISLPPPPPQARVVSMVVGLWVIMSIASWEEYLGADAALIKICFFEGLVSSITISSLKQIDRYFVSPVLCSGQHLYNYEVEVPLVYMCIHLLCLVHPAQLLLTIAEDNPQSIEHVLSSCIHLLCLVHPAQLLLTIAEDNPQSIEHVLSSCIHLLCLVHPAQLLR